MPVEYNSRITLGKILDIALLASIYSDLLIKVPITLDCPNGQHDLFCFWWANLKGVCVTECCPRSLQTVTVFQNKVDTLHGQEAHIAIQVCEQKRLLFKLVVQMQMKRAVTIKITEIGRHSEFPTVCAFLEGSSAQLLVFYRLQDDYNKMLRSAPFPRPILKEHFLLSCLCVWP